MARWKMLGEIIGQITFAFVPIIAKVVLRFSVLQPEESHVHGFGTPGFDAIVGEADGSDVVSSDMGRRLKVAHFF